MQHCTYAYIGTSPYPCILTHAHKRHALMKACMHKRTHATLHICIYMHIARPMHPHTCTHTACTNECMHACRNAHNHKHMCTAIPMYPHTCTHAVCMRACMHACITTHMHACAPPRARDVFYSKCIHGGDGCVTLHASGHHFKPA